MNRQLPPALLSDFDAPSPGRRNRFEWVESSFDDASHSRTQEFLGVSVADRTLGIIFLGIVLLFTVFFIRSAQIQLFEGRAFSVLAERNKQRTTIVPAHRGIVTDRKGTPLAWNVPSFTVLATQSEFPGGSADRDALLAKLARLLEMKKSDLLQTLEGKNRFQPAIVKEHIGYEQSLKLSVALEGMPGVAITVDERREYGFSTSTPSLAHVVGYTGRISQEELERYGALYHANDVVGKEGVELSHESEIHGTAGTRTVEVDALGHEKRVLSEDIPKDGRNTLLTIDLALQQTAERALSDILKKMNKKKGVVIVSDPKTGGIFASVSLPAYENNLFAQGISASDYSRLLTDPLRPLLHRAIYGEYPSGSTIKPLVAVAALEEGVATPSTVVRSTGGLRIGEWHFPDWKAGGHGTTNVVKAIAESVNTYFYMVGGGYGDFRGLGVDRLVSYFAKFGLGEKTGIDLFGEREGFVPTKSWKESKKGEPWYIGDTYHIAIGQGDILVTPLQVNVFTQYFANRGVSYRPHLLEESAPVVFKKDLVAREHVDTVRLGLREAVLSGSARRLSTLPVSAAGKTGTAQWHSVKAPHAWFTGWAPFEKPELVVTVLVEEGEEGSRAATPVAYDIFKWYFSQAAKGGESIDKIKK